MSWFVSFPLLEDRCSGFLSSCYNYDEQECRNKVCVCKEGYRELLDAERKLRHKGFQQCVKNDTNYGNLLIDELIDWLSLFYVPINVDTIWELGA